MLDNLDSRLKDEEPEILELLRLCYWVHKCSCLHNMGKLDPSFVYKMEEIKQQLGSGIRKAAENYQLPVTVDAAHNFQDYNKKIHQILYIISQKNLL